MRGGPARRRSRERAQATVEAAILIPVVVLLLAVVLQVALVAREQVHLTRAASAAARAVMVEPTEATARDALATVGSGLDIESVTISWVRNRGSLVSVAVVVRPTRVPVVGRFLFGFRLRERLVVRLETG